MQNDHVDASHTGSKSDCDASQFTWPVDTEIVLSSGSGKMRLWDQSDLIRWVIHDAMDRVHADLLFECAYPDRRYLIVVMRTSLLDASSRRVEASSIRRRLLFDETYMEKMFPLVRSLIYRNNITNTINSYVPGSHSSEAKLKIGAAASSLLRCWLSSQQMK